MGSKRQCGHLHAAREPLAFLTVTILSLLVPLSFLLLARRFPSENYLLSSGSSTLSFFQYTNPFLVQALVFFIAMAALYHSMTGKSIIQDEPKGPWLGPRLYAAWIFLCTFQVCVGFGVECTVEGSSHKIGLGNGTGVLSRAIFFLGLHETVVHWSRKVVKPVVDGTIFGRLMEERLVQKVSLAGGCGWLWWWRLRDEVGSLVMVAEMKQQLGMNVSLADFVSWWLYYLVVAIGLVRLVRSFFIWVSIPFCCGRIDHDASGSSHIDTDENV